MKAKHLAYCLLTLALCGPLLSTAAHALDRVTIVMGANASSVEKRAGDLLAERIRKETACPVDLLPEVAPRALEKLDLLILLGTPERHTLLARQLVQAGLLAPDTRDPGAEGFLLDAYAHGPGLTLLAAGADERGVLYAVGEILRRLTFSESSVALPIPLKLRTAPAFPIRGLLVSQGATMRELTGARAWTEEEWQSAMLDYALAGANTFELGEVDKENAAQFEFVKSYGLDTLLHVPANAGSGPPEWQAVEAIGRTGYLCPSVPEAREALLQAFENRWKNCPPYDYVRFVSGDGGGCECDRCAPYGAKYIRLVQELATIVRRDRPQTKIFASNQKLDNAGDQAIIDYLNASQEPWLTAFCFGPGSNAMSWLPGRRQDHRMDLFDHPGYGPWSRYFHEVLHQLPDGTGTIMFTDLTHWVYSEYGLMDHALIPDRNGDLPPHWGHGLYDAHPDPCLAVVYDRRTFHARTKAYYRVFREMMPGCLGEVAYSEGHHDEANQWMWQRLLWDPHRSVEAVVGEYAAMRFGPRAAPLMSDAIFQLEDNLSTPIAGNAGIGRCYVLAKEAGARMPERSRKNNALWREYMQRAALDMYIQRRLLRQQERKREMDRILGEALNAGACAAAIEQALALFEQDIETDEMKAFRAEAGRLGEESGALHGVRNEGYFNLDRDFIGLGWHRRELENAAKAPVDQQRELLRRIVHYEDPGEGGFYDDAGDPGRSPHLVFGWPYDGGEVAQSNRPSQRSMAFTSNEKQGLTFRYDGLDPAAQYRVRCCLVRPTYLPRYAGFQRQKCESIYADDAVLIKDLEVPEAESGFFEYEIPREATRDGMLTIRFEKSAGVGEGTRPEVTVWRNTGGWGTVCSELWLMKRQGGVP